jgi:hypothetical protein
MSVGGLVKVRDIVAAEAIALGPDLEDAARVGTACAVERDTGSGAYWSAHHSR